MRESGNIRIESDEYRLLYEQAVQENDLLKQRNAATSFEIDELKKQLHGMQQQLQSKDEKIDQLEGELLYEKRQTEDLERKFDFQALKTERAHEVKMEAEEKVVKLQVIVDTMKREIMKANCSRIILKNQAYGLEEKVKGQKSALKNHVVENEKLAAKIGDLTDLCKRANSRIDADAVLLGNLRKKVKDQEAALDVCGKFTTSVREREAKISSWLEKVLSYYERKASKRCFFIKCHRPSLAYGMAQELADIIVKESSFTKTSSGDGGRHLM